MTIENGKKQILKRALKWGLFLFLPLAAMGDEESIVVSVCPEESGHMVNFNDVPVIEVIRFVSRISEVNFIFNNKELEFNVTLASGKPVSSENVLKALLQMLKAHGFGVSHDEDYYVIHKSSREKKEGGMLFSPPSVEFREESEQVAAKGAKETAPAVAPLAAPLPLLAASGSSEPREFYVYKLQYHQGCEIEDAIKKIAADLANQPEKPTKLLAAIHSMQWVKVTNSLLCSGDPETLESLRKLIVSLDVPLRQVFIEVLVIETDVKKGMEFGLEWAVGGKYSGGAFGMGSFPPGRGGHGFASTMQSMGPDSSPTGLGQIPIGNGFDLGVIGDIIKHRGHSYLTLGSLVSALQVDGDSTIVLNQKIITQDNKNSKIFVGDNIPFTGSVIQTIGQSQQTAANIEYRDIGVNLSITPMLGEGDIITLDIDEEITESLSETLTSTKHVNGIHTTKTNMVTHVHVPDRHFLVLSGMARNAKSHHKAGIPCLGGLPVIGAAFSKTKEQDEKRNIIIFVRPHIIHSFEDYRKISKNQGAPAPYDIEVNLDPKLPPAENVIDK
ncbi:MAG: hypothetical protein HYX48_03355 [Chlamydiales bacterium]|nr:hypothetical protein [Chlamydiales bacterium]